MEALKETEFGTKAALGDDDDARTSNTHILQRKCVIPCSAMKIVTFVTPDNDK